MPHGLAAAAFVRGAARSTAAEPWKATLRPSPTFMLLPPTPIRSSRSPRLRLRTLPTAAAFVHGAARSTAAEPWKATLRPSPTSLPPTPVRSFRSPRLRLRTLPTAAATSRREGAYCNNSSATSRRAKGVPHLGKLVKICLFCLILEKMGRLVPQPKADKTKAAVKFALLGLGLLMGYMAAKNDKKLEFMLKVCDGTMKGYKLFAEIVDLLSTFFN